MQMAVGVVGGPVADLAPRPRRRKGGPAVKREAVDRVGRAGVIQIHRRRAVQNQVSGGIDVTVGRAISSVRIPFASTWTLPEPSPPSD